MQQTDRGNNGVLFALGAYLIWGLSPFFWKQLGDVPALDLVAWRAIFGLLMVGGTLLVLGRRREVGQAAATRTGRLAALSAGALLAANWAIYVWAVDAGRIVEAALGYFINPLLSVFLGVVVLRERLRPAQWIAVGLAVVGVIWLTIDLGTLPWVALTLASTFAIYGLIRKTAPAGPMVGLTLETMVMFVPAVLVLAIGLGDDGGRLDWSAGTWLFIVGTGIITAIPLVLFATGARRVPLSVIGVLQYLAPTLQFLIGWQFYDEVFERGQFVGYAIIWTGLLVFAADGLRLVRETSRTEPALV